MRLAISEGAKKDNLFRLKALGNLTGETADQTHGNVRSPIVTTWGRVGQGLAQRHGHKEIVQRKNRPVRRSGQAQHSPAWDGPWARLRAKAMLQPFYHARTGTAL